jgi:hypothetical protein
MNCTAARELFAELLDSRTPATAHPEARAHLAGCPDCQRDFSALSQTLSALDAMPPTPPSPRLRKNFYAMLEEEKNSAASVRTAERRARRVSLWRWVLSPLAGCALLALGFYAGHRQSPPPAATTSPTEVIAMRDELKQLRQDVGKMGQLVAGALLQQQQGAVNDRLQKVLAAAKEDQPSDQVLSDLVSAVAFDPSVNVRLRALEALYPHSENKIAREGVRVSLPREQDPLVQLEMIDFVAAAHDREAAPVLETIVQNEAGNTNVRDAARRVLAQL